MTTKLPATIIPAPPAPAAVIQPVKPPATMQGWQQRMATAFDALLEQQITPAHGHALADLAEKSALLARLECQIVEVALNNNRTISSDFLPAIEHEDSAPQPKRMRALSGGMR